MTETATKLDRYLMEYEGVGAIIEISTRNTTGDQFEELQKRFVEATGKRADSQWNWPEMRRLYQHDCTPNGIHYGYDLCCDGGMYQLFVLPEHTADMVRDAKQYLRRSFDVVSLSTLRVKTMIDFAA